MILPLSLFLLGCGLSGLFPNNLWNESVLVGVFGECPLCPFVLPLDCVEGGVQRTLKISLD